MSSDALYQIFSSWSILLFHTISFHSSYKIHQLFTDYLLRLPSSELLEKHLFRSRANRRLVFAPFCDISSGPFQRSRNSLLPFLSYIFRVPYLLCDASVLSSRLVYSVKFLEGTVVNLFLQVNVDLRSRMVTWVYLDVLIYFKLFLQVNMDLRCRIVTWFYLDVLIYFELFLQVNLHLRCRMVTWFYLVFIIYFEVFLQVNVDLRCRMVTRVYLDVLIYFKLFLQVNMDLRCRMVTCIYLDFIFYVFLNCFCK